MKEVVASLKALSLPCAFEIVIADDGSTDATPECLAALVEEYPEILRLCG